MVSFVEAHKRLISRLSDVKGRATRAEFWWVMLSYALLIGLLTSTVSIFALGPVLTGVHVMLFVPLTTLSIRRLHDTNLSGWWVLLYIVGSIVQGLIGGLMLLLYLGMVCVGSTPEANKYGPGPHAG